MHRISYASCECMIHFCKPDQEAMKELASTLSSRFSNTADAGSKTILMSHESTLEVPSGKVGIDMTLWKARFGMQITAGDHHDTDDSHALPVPVHNVSDALGLFLEVWNMINHFSVEKASFLLFAAMDLEDGTAPLRLGPDLFNLEERPFGMVYDTALMFKWKPSNVWPGTVVTQILPISPDGKHVHYTASYVLDEDNLTQAQAATWKSSVKDFFSLAIESSSALVLDVLGGGKHAKSPGSV